MGQYTPTASSHNGGVASPHRAASRIKVRQFYWTLDDTSNLGSLVDIFSGQVFQAYNFNPAATALINGGLASPFGGWAVSRMSPRDTDLTWIPAFAYSKNSSWTMTAWIKFNPAQLGWYFDGALFSLANSSGAQSMAIHRNGTLGQEVLFACNGAGASDQRAVPFTYGDNAWHFYAFTYDHGTGLSDGYIDASLVSPGAVVVRQSDMSAGSVFWLSHQQNNVVGAIYDEIGLWLGKALSATELESLYNGGTGRRPSAP